MIGRLLQPLPIPDKPWVIVSMDFITQLIMVQGYIKILVVVDLLSKYLVFVASNIPYNVEEVVNLFFKHIVKYFGLPLNIVSDRDVRFTSKFWTTLFKFVGANLLKS